MSRRTRAAAAALFAGVLLSGCGSAARTANPLRWSVAPQVYAPRDLPQDRIVVGRVANGTRSTVRILATDVRATDAAGHRLQSVAGFTNSYAHGLFGAYQQPSRLPIRELVRLGRLVILDPGAASPLFVSYRLPAGATQPVRIGYGSGTLLVPTAARPTAP